ncbi:sulfurtransferase TusA family protein [Roseomonas sp. M0104]|uniref:Sulfurtransferase TusA family protein n=2 Tax=Teichococcus coralli TaxID=2545983 RepID=A0A845BH80_9PROT|nr:sulfurtransferase TusA family protein [Pseudoroseomonas coralli]MXP65486.1 sulfurtransferase TusA family protein [Pseudoroseomonas coralli]
MENTAPEENLFHQALDITGETCPMTFVRTRLALDRMTEGQVLLVKLRGEEPRQNVPRTATEQGHAVLGQREMPDGSLQVRIRKGGG